MRFQTQFGSWQTNTQKPSQQSQQEVRGGRGSLKFQMSDVPVYYLISLKAIKIWLGYNKNLKKMICNIDDWQLRQYIDQVFMRYDFNRTGTLNLQELHVFLNELFGLCGVQRIVTYNEAYQALRSIDSNRDGQVNKYELFNLFRYMTQPGFQPLPYSYGSYTYGGLGGGLGYGGVGGVGYGGVGGLGYGGVTTYNTGIGGYPGGGVYTSTPYNTYGGSTYSVTTTTSYPATTTYSTGGCIPTSYSTHWGGW